MARRVGATRSSRRRDGRARPRGAGWTPLAGRCAVAVLSATSATAACTGSPARFTPGPTELTGTVAAVSLARPLDGSPIDISAGAIALIDGQGRTRMIGTDGIDAARVASRDGRFFFQDRTHDYILGDNLRTIERKSVQYTHDFLLPQSGGASYVAVFNGRVTDDGKSYLYHVARGDGSTVAESTISAYLHLIGACGDRVFAIPMGMQRAGVASAARTLLQIDGPTPRAVASWTPPQPMEGAGGHMTCSGDVLHYLDMAHRPTANPTELAKGDPDSTVSTNLVSWDTVSGTVRSTPLVTTDGAPIGPLDPAADRSASHVHDGRFHWIDGSGWLRSADPVTGIVRQVGRLPVSTHGLTQYDFVDAEVFVFETERAGAAWLGRFRLSDATMVWRVDVPGIAEYSRSTKQSVHDLAVWRR